MLTELDTKIRDYCSKNRMSCAVRVTHADQVLLDSGYGFADHEKKLPFTKSSMFTFYSLSKPFCALGLLQLVDQGLVELDAHPGRYVPEAAGLTAGLRCGSCCSTPPVCRILPPVHATSSLMHRATQARPGSI